MTIMESGSEVKEEDRAPAASAAPEEEGSAKKDSSGPVKAVPKKKSPERKSIFSSDDLDKDSVLDTGEPKEDRGLDLGSYNREITITSDDKTSFIDSVVANTRFTRDYSLFGGKITLTVRSLTTDEVNALAVWIAKIGSSDPSGLMAGRYRKYLMAAHIEMYNGTKMPPLEEPLYETLESDGKTVKPQGWLKRCGYWDGIGVGVFNAIMGCLADFDLRYTMLCKEAANGNFWNPDTP